MTRKGFSPLKEVFTAVSGVLSKHVFKQAKHVFVSPNEDNLRRCDAALLSRGSVCGLGEVTAGNSAGQGLRSMGKQQVWKPYFGLWASVLDHKSFLIMALL